ncbi:UNVERIFIED_CONTAM: hypothetical protein FKN15_011309 [Acipenser sinensis]
MNGRQPGFIKMVRHDKQEGLIRSRVSGWRAATAPVVALFDAHVEFNVGWAEPILLRIKEDRTRIISPSFDNIKYDNFEIEEYPLSAQGFDWELWCRYLNPPKSWWNLGNSTAPIRSPALIGCFVVDRQYFEEIGLLDEGMEVYGGENVELGIRNVYYTSSQQLHVGVLSPTVDDDDNKCLVDVNSRPKLIECSYAKAKRMKLYWLFTQKPFRIPEPYQQPNHGGDGWHPAGVDSMPLTRCLISSRSKNINACYDQAEIPYKDS